MVFKRSLTSVYWQTTRHFIRQYISVFQSILPGPNENIVHRLGKFKVLILILKVSLDLKIPDDLLDLPSVGRLVFEVVGCE